MESFARARCWISLQDRGSRVRIATRPASDSLVPCKSGKLCDPDSSHRPGRRSSSMATWRYERRAGACWISSRITGGDGRRESPPGLPKRARGREEPPGDVAVGGVEVRAEEGRLARLSRAGDQRRRKALDSAPARRRLPAGWQLPGDRQSGGCVHLTRERLRARRSALPKPGKGAHRRGGCLAGASGGLRGRKVSVPGLERTRAPGQWVPGSSHPGATPAVTRSRSGFGVSGIIANTRSRVAPGGVLYCAIILSEAPYP